MKRITKILYLCFFFYFWSGNIIQGQTIFDFIKEAPKAKWQAYKFQRGRGNFTIPFNGNTADKKGYVKVTRKLLEDGSTKKVLQLHPKYPTTIVASGTYGIIKSLPANAAFTAHVGFLKNRRTPSNKETHFRVSIHYSENGRKRVKTIWTSNKKYTGQLEEVKISLAEYEGKEVYFSFAVNNKRHANPDIAVWENPIILVNQTSNDEITAGPNVKKTLNLLVEMADTKLAALIETPENPFGAVDIFKGKVFYDKNEKSGVFYYLPGHFSLDWDQKKGAYQFDITYPEDGSGEKNVRMSAQFSSSINSEMVDLLERIVSKVTNRKDVQVRPFPIAVAPKVTFPFAEYNIAQSDITLNQFSDFSKPMSVSWAMAQDDVEAFVAAMAKRVYFDGNVSWQVKGLDSAIEVPIHFSLIASKTIGQFYYTKMGDLLYKGFKNNTAFRLKLKSIKALNKVKGSPLIFEEVLLPNTIVEPYATFKGFSAQAKINLNTYPAHLLLDYEIIPCEECEANAVRSVLKNGVANLEQTVEIWDLGATKFTNALAIKLEVKELAKSINVAEGERIEKAFKAPRLLNGQLAYKYKVTIILPNGPLTSRTIKSSETSIYLTEDFIKEHFEEFRN
ncbi:MAG: hypothetical protein ACI85O_000678 [Saprospiraceae bacterium]|jgi:hypothetical protein